MATAQQVRAWIEQSEADLSAATATTGRLRECHRRYWIQQSYEKSIKALALMRWTGTPDEEAGLSRHFLLHHSPLKTIASRTTPLSKALRLLSREIDSFVAGLDNAKLLRRIDATTPRNDPAEISYRYPFLVDGSYVAPAAYDDWDQYQGNEQGAVAAVDRLIRAVRTELAVFSRKPG